MIQIVFFTLFILFGSFSLSPSLFDDNDASSEVEYSKKINDGVALQGFFDNVSEKEESQASITFPRTRLVFEKQAKIGVAYSLVLVMDGNQAVGSVPAVCEVSWELGTGSIKVMGNLASKVVEDQCNIAYSHIKKNGAAYDLGSVDFTQCDIIFNCYAPSLLGGCSIEKENSFIGLAVFIAMVSALRSLPVSKGVVFCGNVNLQGHFYGFDNFAQYFHGLAVYNFEKIVVSKDVCYAAAAARPFDMDEKINIYGECLTGQALLPIALETKPGILTV